MEKIGTTGQSEIKCDGEAHWVFPFDGSKAWKSMPCNCEKSAWEARPKISRAGNFSGFRVFKNGVKVFEHINALRAEDAIKRAIERTQEGQ